MQKKIHPQYIITKIKCACGAVYEIPGTAKQIEVEICKNCSPLFTGTEEKKVILGQVEKFLKRKAKAKPRIDTAIRIKKQRQSK
jgi:large subunit ribosomal protein L31